MTKPTALIAALVLVAGASCGGGGVRARETRITPTTSPASTSSSPNTSSTSSTSTTLALDSQRPSSSTTSRSRPPATVRGSSVAGAGGEAMASWYGAESGSSTANGEHFDGTSLTFAHRTLAFGTRVRFCHDGRCVVARCNDRGPFVAGRTFDLSRATFASIASTGAGVISVRWAVVA